MSGGDALVNTSLPDGYKLWDCYDASGASCGCRKACSRRPTDGIDRKARTAELGRSTPRAGVRKSARTTSAASTERGRSSSPSGNGVAATCAQQRRTMPSSADMDSGHSAVIDRACVSNTQPPLAAKRNVPQCSAHGDQEQKSVRAVVTALQTLLKGTDKVIVLEWPIRTEPERNSSRAGPARKHAATDAKACAQRCGGRYMSGSLSHIDVVVAQEQASRWQAVVGYEVDGKEHDYTTKRDNIKESAARLPVERIDARLDQALVKDAVEAALLKFDVV